MEAKIIKTYKDALATHEVEKPPLAKFTLPSQLKPVTKKIQRSGQCFKKTTTKSYDISHVHLYDIIVINTHPPVITMISHSCCDIRNHNIRSYVVCIKLGTIQEIYKHPNMTDAKNHLERQSWISSRLSLVVLQFTKTLLKA